MVHARRDRVWAARHPGGTRKLGTGRTCCRPTARRSSQLFGDADLAAGSVVRQRLSSGWCSRNHWLRRVARPHGRSRRQEVTGGGHGRPPQHVDVQFAPPGSRTSGVRVRRADRVDRRARDGRGPSLWGGQANFEAGEAVESQRLAQRIIDLADGDPVMGNVLIGSPLAWAITLRGASAMFLGRPGWRADIERGIAMAQSFDATTRILAQVYKFAGATGNDAIVPDAEDISLTSESLEIALQSGDNTAVTYSYMIRATALLHSPEGDQAAGIEALT